MKINIIPHSLYSHTGHTFRMAEAIADGVLIGRWGAAYLRLEHKMGDRNRPLSDL